MFEKILDDRFQGFINYLINWSVGQSGTQHVWEMYNLHFTFYSIDRSGQIFLHLSFWHWQWHCWHFTMLAFDILDIWHSWHFLHLTLLTFDIVDIWRCWHLTFLPFDILAIWHSWHLTLLTFDIVDIWHCWHLTKKYILTKFSQNVFICKRFVKHLKCAYW